MIGVFYNIHINTQSTF